MLKINKIISLILLVVMFTSTVSFSSLAADSDDTYNNIEGTYSFLSDIIDVDSLNVSLSDSEIKRGDFLALVIQIAKLPLSEGTLEFTDIKPNHEYYNHLVTAVKLGLISSHSGNFNPDNAITLNEALKIMTSALGYGDIAIVTGGYPVGYINVAKRIDLLENIDESAPLDGNMLTQLIYNFVTADLMEIGGITDDGYTYESTGKTILSQNYGYSVVSGTINTAGVASLKSTPPETPEFEVSGNVYKSAISDAGKYLGLYADVYYDDTNTVVAVYPHDNDIIVINPDDIYEYSYDKLSVSVDDTDKTKNYKLSSDLSFVKNGRLIAHTDDNFNIDCGSFTLIDNNNDNIYDIVLAEDITYVVAGTVDIGSKILYNKYGGGKFDFEDVAYTGSRYDLATGVTTPISFEEIESGMFIELKISDDKEIIEFKVINNTITGTISEKNDESVIINGTEYDMSKYFVQNSISLQFNTNYTFYLDSNNKIAYVAPASSDSMQYGFLMDYGKDNGLNSKVYIKLLESTGKVAAFELSDDIIFDGKKYKSSDSIVENALYRGGNVIYQLIRYKTGSKGTVTVIDTATVPEGELTEKYGNDDKNNNSLTLNISKKTGLYAGDGKTMVPLCTVSGSQVFMVPKGLTVGEEYNEADFSVGALNILSQHYSYVMDAYDFNDEMIPSVVVLYANDATPLGEVKLTEPLNYSNPVVVDSVSVAIDDNGDISKKIRVVEDRKFKAYYISPEIEKAMISADISLPKPGDVMRISVYNGNQLKGIAVDAPYNKSTRLPDINALIYGGEYGQYTYRTYSGGKVFAMSSESITLKADSYIGSENIVDDLVTYGLNVTNIVKFNRTTNKCESARLTDVITVLEAGENDASYVCIKTEYGKARAIIMYVD